MQMIVAAAVRITSYSCNINEYSFIPWPKRVVPNARSSETF